MPVETKNDSPISWLVRNFRYIVIGLFVISIVTVNLIAVLNGADATQGIIGLINYNAEKISLGIGALVAAFFSFAGIERPPEPPQEPLYGYSEVTEALKKQELKRGDAGPQVIEAQMTMNLWGCALEVDGKFGKETEGCVISIQEKEGLEKTGSWDHATMHALGKLLPQKT